MGLFKSIEKMQRAAVAKSDPTGKAARMPDYAGEQGQPKVRGWQGRQRELLQAARTLGVDTLAPGQHTKDGTVTAGLRYLDGEVGVYVAGWQVGELDADDSAWVGRWLRAHGAEHGGAYVGRVEARIYHYEHGRWGVLIYL